MTELEELIAKKKEVYLDMKRIAANVIDTEFWSSWIEKLKSEIEELEKDKSNEN
jgi:hypothetical protein